MEGLLEKLAVCINNNAVLVQASVPEELEEYRTIDGSEIKVSLNKVLYIVVKHMYGKYANGHVWKIFEQDIERAVNNLTRKDKRLTERIKHEQLSTKDCERIVKKASFNLISLPLTR